MRKLFKILLVVFLILVLVFAGLSIYIEVYQKQILARVQTELKKNIRGELTIEKISLSALSNFPFLSLTVIHPVIKDSVYHQKVFEANKIYFKLNTLQLLRLKIDARSMVLENGLFHILQDSTGYSTGDIFKVKSQESSGSADVNLEMEALRIQNLKIVFDDDVRNRHMSLVVNRITGNVSKSDGKFIIPLTGKVHIDSMLFKADKGSFMVNMDAALSAHLEFDPEKLQLDILPSKIVVDSQDYEMKGLFNFARKPAYMELTISNPITDFSKAKHILSKQITDKMVGIEVNDRVDVNVFIRGDVIPDLPPEVDASFKLRNAWISASGVELTGVNLDGLFMNHVKPGVKNDDPNSAILFDIKSAKVYDVPFSLKASVTDLKALFLELTLSARTPLTALNNIVPADKYRFTAGDAAVDLAYSGSLHYYIDTLGGKFDDTLKGAIKVNNGSFVYYKRKLQLDSMNADIDLSIGKVDIRNLSTLLNGNLLVLQGSVTGLRKIMASKEEKMIGRFTLNAPVFDLTKVLIESKGTAAAAPPVTKAQEVKGAKQATETIDMITDRLTAIINFKSDLFTYRKFTAKNVKGEVALSSNGLWMKDFTLNACKGSLKINGGLNSSGPDDRLEVDVAIKNVDVEQFLKSAENFNQDAITSQNLTGQLSLNVNFNALLDKTYVPNLDSMTGIAHFSLKGGRLKNFEPMMNVGKTIFKKRDFANISFAEIHDTLVLKNGKLFIKRMEIATSILRVFVLGRYAFKGLTDIAIQFPLNNLKRPDINYQPENIGTDAKVGANIIVRVHGGKNKTKITLDPSAMRRLEKEME